MLLDDKLKQYKHYENLIKMAPEQSITETFEYQSFSEAYPNIAELILLKKMLTQLNNELNAQKDQRIKFKLKQRIRVIKSQLKKTNLKKRLHGEGKQEKVFHKKFKSKVSKNRNTVIKKKIRKKVGQPIGTVRTKIRMTMHRNLPPTLFNLRNHDVTEKSLMLREWLQEKRDRNEKSLD